MRELMKISLPLSGLLLLSACAGFGLQEAKKSAPSGSAFNTALYDGYLDLSDQEFREGDYADSDVFAGRAIQVAANSPVAPEAIAARDLPGDRVRELSGAREGLVEALAAGAADRKPADAAHAQVMFDCWMQEQEENFQPDDIAKCRAEFMAALARIQEAPKVAAAPPTPAPAPIPGPYVVFFDFDKDELTNDAKTILAKVINDAKAVKGAKIVAAGYTDRSGADKYNDALSARRVDAVISYLLQSGLEKANVMADAFGEAHPVVITADDVPEARNRRVEITFTR